MIKRRASSPGVFNHPEPQLGAKASHLLAICGTAEAMALPETNH